MSGHQHLGGPGLTQNQGNIIGDHPCVRQSRIYRQHLGGNAMKELMGQDQLKWDTNRTQGAYEGGRVYDADRDAPGVRAGQQEQYANQQTQQNNFQQQPQQNYQQQPQQNYQQQPQQQQPPQQQLNTYQRPQQQQQQQQPEANPGHRRGAGNANKSTYNLISGQ